jgi:hypothetical protein
MVIPGSPAPWSGNYAPRTGGGFYSHLWLFSGESALGIWRLTVRDTEGQDIGSFSSWELTLETATIPEPATLWLLGTGLAAAGMRRRMKKRG